MLKNLIFKSGLAVIWISLLFITGCASTATKEDAQARVKAAESTLAEFERDPGMTWLHNNMKHAKAIMVSPGILRAGFVFGASGGPAVVLARGSGPTGWNGPAFYKLAAGSVGFQAGAESSEMVALIMTDKALNSLLSNSFEMGSGVSFAAGPVGAGASAPITSDIVAFTRSKGLYGGLNLDGTVVSVDEEGNRSFYGRAATPADILITGSVSSPDAIPLARLASGAGVPATGSSTSGTSSSGTR